MQFRRCHYGSAKCRRTPSSRRARPMGSGSRSAPTTISCVKLAADRIRGNSGQSAGRPHRCNRAPEILGVGARIDAGTATGTSSLRRSAACHPGVRATHGVSARTDAGGADPGSPEWYRGPVESRSRSLRGSPLAAAACPRPAHGGVPQWADWSTRAGRTQTIFSLDVSRSLPCHVTRFRRSHPSPSRQTSEPGSR